MTDDRRDAAGELPTDPEPEAAGDWEELVAEVENGLESLRCRELSRRRGGLRELDPEDREVVDRLTRDLLQHAVLEGLWSVVRARRGMSPGEMRDIRAMFVRV